MSEIVTFLFEVSCQEVCCCLGEDPGHSLREPGQEAAIEDSLIGSCYIRQGCNILRYKVSVNMSRRLLQRTAS